ncbi:hypothetical protein T459_16456 [Capsicum annuum]|uniref:Replication protein A 70 kDa DNA-binding subunit B/D first OB fold domain-containing protein n=1 Tax=Capsicum annuum TaxID=4072 RepID=A0A2G2Z8W3_CAPAN|nr:hypothetical protein T459_16456 [Capsicum annuum]
MQWCLKVRVVRLWVIPDREKEDNPQSMEMVLQDKKEDRIHATVGRYVMRLFKGKISELGLYIMKKFVVGPNIFKFKTTKHRMRLTFTNRTMVEEINDPLFEKYSVRNTWHASKLWVNPDLPQVVDFKTSLIGVHGDNTLRVSQISTQHSYSVSDELLSGDVEGKTIVQLVECLHTTDFDEDGAYPVELNTILDKNALFKDPNFICEKVAAETHEIADSNPDNDLNTPTNTQAKRSLLEVESLSIEVEDDPNTQLSSTKLNKVVKKEKLA